MGLGEKPVVLGFRGEEKRGEGGEEERRVGEGEALVLLNSPILNFSPVSLGFAGGE